MLNRIRIVISILAMCCLALTVVAQPNATRVDKLIAQLGAKDFAAREKATSELTTLGQPILPALRNAAKTNVELEVKRRIESVILRIEEGIIREEEKLWEKLAEPQRGLKDRVAKIHARTPNMNSERLTTAVYLVTAGRAPTDDEAKAGQTRFAVTQVRLLEALKLARPLAHDNAIAAASARLFQLQKALSTDADLATQLARLNGPEHQKMLTEIARALSKVARSDEHFCDLAFLLVLSRFPDRNQQLSVTGHLKKAPNGDAARVDVVWALINSAEFIKAP